MRAVRALVYQCVKWKTPIRYCIVSDNYYMSMNADLTKIVKKEHEEKWVALSKDHSQVIDFAENLKVLRDRMAEKRNEYVYMRVLRSDMQYSFSHHDSA